MSSAHERRVRLFRNGSNQAVRIPRDMELPGEEATVRREGDRLIVEAAVSSPLLDLLAGLEAIDDQFPGVDEHLRPAADVDL